MNSFVTYISRRLLLIGLIGAVITIYPNDRKGVVSLREELEFIEAFRFVIEVRFANKLTFSIQIDEAAKDTLVLPVLSLLPLVVSNPIYPKLTAPLTNGTGLKNLENRFILLTNRKVRVESTNEKFMVYLPLK